MAEITLLDDKEPEPEEGADDPVRYVVTAVNFHQNEFYLALNGSLQTGVRQVDVQLFQIMLEFQNYWTREKISDPMVYCRSNKGEVEYFTAKADNLKFPCRILV